MDGVDGQMDVGGVGRWMDRQTDDRWMMNGWMEDYGMKLSHHLTSVSSEKWGSPTYPLETYTSQKPRQRPGPQRQTKLSQQHPPAHASFSAPGPHGISRMPAIP